MRVKTLEDKAQLDTGSAGVSPATALQRASVWLSSLSRFALSAGETPAVPVDAMLVTDHPSGVVKHV